MLFQATTLNVAFNSHNKALLTIMMSNNVSEISLGSLSQVSAVFGTCDRPTHNSLVFLQFVELKGSVFKKFEKNNLFQMSCSDVRERFHFLVLLAIVCVRNLTEFSWNLGTCANIEQNNHESSLERQSNH